MPGVGHLSTKELNAAWNNKTSTTTTTTTAAECTLGQISSSRSD